MQGKVASKSPRKSSLEAGTLQKEDLEMTGQGMYETVDKMETSLDPEPTGRNSKNFIPGTGGDTYEDINKARYEKTGEPAEYLYNVLRSGNSSSRE